MKRTQEKYKDRGASIHNNLGFSGCVEMNGEDLSIIISL